jgi:hypothetical protein
MVSGLSVIDAASPKVADGRLATGERNGYWDLADATAWAMQVSERIALLKCGTSDQIYDTMKPLPQIAASPRSIWRPV